MRVPEERVNVVILKYGADVLMPLCLPLGQWAEPWSSAAAPQHVRCSVTPRAVGHISEVSVELMPFIPRGLAVAWPRLSASVRVCPMCSAELQSLPVLSLLHYVLMTFIPNSIYRTLGSGENRGEQNRSLLCGACLLEDLSQTNGYIRSCHKAVISLEARH